MRVVLLFVFAGVACNWYPPPPEPGFGDNSLVEYFGSLSINDIDSVWLFDDVCEEGSGGVVAKAAYPELLRILSTLEGLHEKPLGTSDVHQVVELRLHNHETVRLRLVSFSRTPGGRALSVLHHDGYHAMFEGEMLDRWVAELPLALDEGEAPQRGSKDIGAESDAGATDMGAMPAVP